MTLYVSDLDGTLLDSTVQVTAQTVVQINELIDSGLMFTAATARTYASAGKILDGLKLNLPVVLMNGVLIFNPSSHQYELINTLSREIVDKIILLVHTMRIDCFMYGISDGMMMTYFENLSNKGMEDFYTERRVKYYKAFTKVDDFSQVKSDIIYFCFLDTKEKLQPIYEKLNSLDMLATAFYKDIYSQNLWYLEVFSSNASKKQAILYLKEKYGFDKICAFGDNLNDLPMFEIADEKYAVSNANEQVKMAADGIIGSNNDNGVAEFLYNRYKKGTL